MCRDLKTCVANGDENVLHLHYEDVMRSRRSTGNTFKLAREMMQTTPRERAMFSWVEFITVLSFPIGYIQNSISRNFSKHNERIFVTTLKKVLSSLTRIVEDVIKKEITNMQGAMMHDGWTYIGINYLGVFEIYMRPVLVLRNGQPEQHEELAMPLLFVSPIASIHYENENLGEENYRVWCRISCQPNGRCVQLFWGLCP